MIKNGNEQIWRAFGELINRFGTDLMIFIFDDPFPLLEAISSATHHCSRRVALITFEFWSEYRQTL